MSQQTFEITHSSDVGQARRAATLLARDGAFGEPASENVGLVVNELATNLLKHAGGGILSLARIVAGERTGLQIEAHDNGPGIADVEEAITDGFSTTGTLGNGLGAVNRLMHEFQITSHRGQGTHIVCKRWLPLDTPTAQRSPLSFGVATRPVRQSDVNGDSFVLKQWGQSALVAVIDGLGHGPMANRASQAAASFVDGHYEQPFDVIFRGVERACHATRGVVMALARFDWADNALTFASVGNIETHVFNSPEPMRFVVRRGVVGLNAPKPVITTHPWQPSNFMVMHSDGLKSHWRWEEFPDCSAMPADAIAQRLMRALAKDRDDATVIVVREAVS